MDNFSRLPDEVLSHILSFLTTKEAALTSVLAKRWRNLFAFVPNLEFDDSVFLHPEEGKQEREDIIQSFMDFVDRILALQGNSPIKKFSLKCKTDVGYDDENHLDGWICNVLQRGVLDLDLFIDDENLYQLPYKIFYSSTLVNLKLGSDCGFPLWPDAEGTFLPMLKTLVIDQAWICWDELKMFLPAFPVLEELSMDSLEWRDPNNNVSSASLRKLTIYASGCEDLFNPKSISFDTPSLVYLEYSDFVAEDYPKLNLTNIVEALLNLMVTEDQIELIRAPNDEDDDSLRLRNVWKLFSGIRNVQKLFFSAVTLEVFSLCCESMLVFNNLKYLRIKSVADRGWQAMPVLLKNCPHLDTLVLQGLLHFETDKCGDACNCISREDKGRSLISCPVKKLQIKGFRGTKRELGMIKHFLESFRCLEEMKIYAEEKDPTEFEIPGRFELVTEMMNLYDELLSCDIQFLVCTPLYQKWSAQG